jgi:cell division septation protein DedD
MSNDRRDDQDQDNSAEDWNPWLEDDSSDDELPSFSHDSDEEASDFRRYDESRVRNPIDDDDGRDSDEPIDPTLIVPPPVSPVRSSPPAYRPLEDAGSSDEEADDYDDADSWDDDLRDDEYQPTEASRFTDTWPVGLIAVAALALVLLAAGGYGVMKQRAAMEQEIRDLQAELAVAANPEEVSNTSASLATLQAENTELRTTLSALQDENRQLRDTSAGLEQQLVAQREAASRASPAAPTTAAAPRPTPAPVQAAAPASSGDWFVNFGSYSERSVAEQWSARLKPSSGRVTVTSVQREGSTYYRVRVIGLASDSQAQAVARKLEQDYSLPKLWVGRE